jgi:flavin prenyltransferase
MDENKTVHPILVAITGASGAVYAARLLDCLRSAGQDVHLTISPSGQAVLKQELDVEVDLERFSLEQLRFDSRWLHFQQPPASRETRPADKDQGRVVYHHYRNFMAPIASGSFLTSAMVICPCSGSTLSALAHGTGSNLIHRAADVHLKERRKLVLVPRETPLSGIYLENLKRASDAGAVVLPAMPGWYHPVRSLGDLVDFVVARILDHLRIEHDLMHRWGTTDDV